MSLTSASDAAADMMLTACLAEDPRVGRMPEEPTIDIEVVDRVPERLTGMRKATAVQLDEPIGRLVSILFPVAATLAQELLGSDHSTIRVTREPLG